MKLNDFNQKWHDDGFRKKVSRSSVELFFGDKTSLLPETYINMVCKFGGMINSAYLVSAYCSIEFLLYIGNDEYSIGKELQEYESFENSEKFNLIPFSSNSSYYEWCFDFDNLKNGQPTVSLHSWQGGICHCIDKDGKEIYIDTNEVEDEFGVVVNTNLTFDEFISKLKCEED